MNRTLEEYFRRHPADYHPFGIPDSIVRAATP